MVHNAGQWCTLQVGGAQLVLYHGGSTQGSCHKPRQTDKRTLPNLLSPCYTADKDSSKVKSVDIQGEREREEGSLLYLF